MKKYIGFGIIVCSFFSLPTFAKIQEAPMGIFEVYNIPDTSLYLIKDNRTGCEYLTSERTSIEFVRGSCDKSEDNKDMGDKK